MLREINIGIKEQFPEEIEKRRHKLYGVMKRAKHEGRHVSFVRDKLYIDGELHVLPDNQAYHNPHIRTRTSDRQINDKELGLIQIQTSHRKAAGDNLLQTMWTYLTHNRYWMIPHVLIMYTRKLT